MGESSAASTRVAFSALLPRLWMPLRVAAGGAAALAPLTPTPLEAWEGEKGGAEGGVKELPCGMGTPSRGGGGVCV